MDFILCGVAKGRTQLSTFHFTFLQSEIRLGLRFTVDMVSLGHHSLLTPLLIIAFKVFSVGTGSHRLPCSQR